MLLEIEDKVQTRVERHLAQSPRFATLHGLFFTASVLLFGLLTILFSSGGGFPGLLYLMLVLWSVPLALHTTFAFWQSGAWRGRRSRLVRDEVLDAGETYDLSTDEMIDLHVRVDETIRKQAQPFNRVLLYGLGSLVLWPGSVAGVLFLNIFGLGYWFGNFTNLLALLLMGSFVLGLLLPLGQLRYLLPGGAPVRDQYRRDAHLREMYAHKRKRHLSEAERRLSDWDETEEAVELDQLVEIKRKTR